MDLFLLTARLLLAAVFLVAGLAKLADRAGSQQALAGFGVPDRLAAPLTTLLPLAELAVAVALIPVLTAWWGALGALALLLIFVGGIGYNLARGRAPDCHCFGQIHSAPAGWPTLARNALLAVVAGFVAWQGPASVGPSGLAWLGELAADQIVALLVGVVVVAVLAVEGWLLLHLIGQNGRLLLRIEALEARPVGGAPATPAAAPAGPAQGLPVGAPAPRFSLAGLYGETLTLDALRARDKPVMLVFSDPGCGPCNALLPDLARWQREHVTNLTIAMVTRGAPDVNRAKSAEHGLTHVLIQKDREVAEAYEAHATPTAVIVLPDGTIGSALAPGADAISALVARTVGEPDRAQLPMAGPAPAQPVVAKVGDAAPALKLPDLTGKMIDLASFRGSPTLVLFWNPSCGFCKQMLDDLKAWETQRPKSAPKLLIVSTGTVEDNHALGLRSPLLLDQSFSAGRAFGANGTPMAVLVDAKGKIDSQVVAGAPAVLELARDPHQIKLGSG